MKATKLLGVRQTESIIVMPDEVPGLKHWGDLRIESYEDNDIVTTITDASGNSTDLEALGSPTFHKNVLNGKSAIRFDGTQGLFNLDRTKFDFMHQGDHTVFFVLQSTDVTTIQTFFDNQNASPSVVGLILQTSINTPTPAYDAGFFVLLANGSGTAIVQERSLADEWEADTPMILVFRYENGAAGSDYTVQKDNRKDLITSESVGALSAATSTTVPNFFIRGNQLTQGFTGDVFEWFAYDRALTDLEISQLLGVGLTKYGL